MTVTPAEIAGLAKRLAGGAGEIEWRASISRSFYAAYHRSLPLGAEFRAGVVGGHHEALIKHLITGAGENIASRKTMAMRIGYKLQSLRGLRVSADYELDTDIGSKDAALALKTGDDVSILVEEFRI